MADINEMRSKWQSNSRSAKRARNNLGIIFGGDAGENKKYRNPKLEELDRYYEGTQYDHLMGWEEALKASCEDDTYVGIRDRKPRINYKFAKILCARVAAKLVGEGQFPTIKVEDDPDTEEFFKAILKLGKLKSVLAEPVRRSLAAGAVFIRFSFMGGSLRVEHYCSKYCYPEFLENGEIGFLKIQYVYEDLQDKDASGKPKQKWYRLDLGQMSDILYDNPEYKKDSEPTFTVVNSVEHNLGFVQGEWIRTSIDRHNPDGYSLIEDALDFIDELNYSLSQSSQAISYNQDPQLIIKGMDIDELDKLVRSSQKAWNLGREGEANFLETSLTGVERASESRDKMKVLLQDVTRIVMMEPEKMVAQAQSGKALEVLHGPFVELINELRPIYEEAIMKLLLKIGLTVLILNSQGVDVGMEIPEGWQPASLDLSATWPPVFPMTMQDLRDKLNVGLQASNANIISRETILKWVAADFGIENLEEELAKVASQPIINPYGAF